MRMGMLFTMLIALLRAMMMVMVVMVMMLKKKKLMKMMVATPLVMKGTDLGIHTPFQVKVWKKTGILSERALNWVAVAVVPALAARGSSSSQSNHRSRAQHPERALS